MTRHPFSIRARFLLVSLAIVPVALALVWFATVVAGARYLAWS